MATVKTTIKRSVKKLHPVTKAVMVIAFLLALVAGALCCYFVSRNDGFELCGNKTISLDAGGEGATYLYTEEGVSAKCFGLDVSGKTKVKTDLEKNAQGQYVIPLDKEGVYTISYTVSGFPADFKFGAKSANGEIVRIRTFTVAAREEDGQGE